MYVDDDVAMHKLANISLKLMGKFDVLICGSGKEALEKVESYNPDLIILDVMMPEMDGTEAIGHLQNIPVVCDTPIVFLTGKDKPEDKEKLLQLGAVGVIQKPFQPKNLPMQVSKIWEQWNQKLA